MREISIFAKPAYYRRSVRIRYPHIIRGSSLVRGDQIASYLGCKLNPESGYENDLCIYVKPITLDHIKDGDWVDIMDGDHIIDWLQDRPDIKVINFGETANAIYREMANNRMVIIPPHHCNFDRELRTRKEITTVGYIGGEGVFHHPMDDMKKLVENAGLKFVYSFDYKTREDVIDFYKQIDIQLVWCRPKYVSQSRVPTKYVNAASFGIPTVGYPQVCCKEVDGKYIKAHNLGELIDGLKRLKDYTYYESWSSRLPETAEPYHISNIAEKYRQLD